MERERSKTVEEAKYLDLPDDCWEYIFKFLNDDDDDDDYYDHNRNLKSLSLVSKQFFSIDLTHFHFQSDLDLLLRQIFLFPLKLTSLNLSQKSTIPANALRIFSQRITTLTSLTCSKLHYFNPTHLFLIAHCFPLLQILDLSDPYPRAIRDYNDNCFLHGIQALSLSLSKLVKINLSGHCYMDDKSIFHLFNNCKLLQHVIMLDCHRITKAGVASALSEKKTPLRYLSLPHFITAQQVIDSLLSFKGLTNIDMTYSTISDQLLTSIAMEGLPLKSIAIPYCKGYTYTGLFTLLSKCQSIQHLHLQDAAFLNDSHVLDLSLYLVGLVSVNLSFCPRVTESSLLALVRKCPSLSQIIMKDIGGKTVENHDYLMDFGVYPQLYSLNMSCNLWLGDESIIMFASVFPNLHRLELTSYRKISDDSTVHVLRRCRKISHLDLSFSWLKLLEMDFELPKLKMLNLPFSNINDETLYSISKSCCGLLQLLINSCLGCTEKGVKHVVEKCTQLREIHLRDCSKVRTNVAASVLFSSPSLRKITAPPHIHFSESERKLFLRRGCIIC